jgi:glycosyltransferase involved in cell wall biosynthesis
MINKTKIRPKILVLTPRFPYPVVGGDRLRIYEICKELAKYSDLTLLSICENTDEMTYEIPHDGVFCNVHRVILPKWQAYYNVLSNLFGSKPLQVSYYQSRKFKALLKSLASKHDLLFAHLIRMAHYMDESPLPGVVEMTDAISMNYERSQRVASTFNFLSIVHRIEVKRLKLYEKKAIEKYDLLSFVSKTDSDFLYGKDNVDKVIVCNNGVDTNILKFGLPSNRLPVVAFIGNMKSMQNRDAASWFAKKVLPLLRKNGDFRFRIVGQIEDRHRAMFESIEGVHVTGKVDSVAVAAKECFSAVCPVRIGAGVQNKLLEYMAVGLPSVSTSIGVEGLAVEDGRELWVANSPEEFVSILMYIWENEASIQSIISNARAYVNNNHIWSETLHELTQSVADMARESKARKN